MTSGGETYLNQVRDIVLRYLRGHAARVYLFGSHAKGAPRRSSDVDVAIEPKATLPSGLLAELREALEESTVPWRVEVVDLSETDAAFRERVLKEGIVWNA